MFLSERFGHTFVTLLTRVPCWQIDGLTPEKSGQFLTYNGSQLPW
jgi:hypothetical protein